MRRARVAVLAGGALLAAASCIDFTQRYADYCARTSLCGDGGSGPGPDGGLDGGPDAAVPDGGIDAGVDGGGDAGLGSDAGVDAGAWQDAGSCAGVGFTGWCKVDLGFNTANFMGVWEGTQHDVYAVGGLSDGGGGIIVQLDVTNPSNLRELTVVEPQVLGAVWGVATGNVYAVGNFGQVLHLVAGQWQVEDAGTSENLYGLHGDSSGVYAVGVGRTVVFTDGGGQWLALPQMAGQALLQGVTASDQGDLRVISVTGVGGITTEIWSFDAGVGGWVSEYTSTVGSPLGIWAASSSDAVVVGGFTDDAGAQKPFVLHLDAGQWVPDTVSAPGRLHAVWGASSSDLYAVGGSGLVVHSAGDGQWTQQPSLNSTLLALFGQDGGGMWAVGPSSGIYFLASP